MALAPDVFVRDVGNNTLEVHYEPDGTFDVWLYRDDVETIGLTLQGEDMKALELWLEPRT